MAPYVTIPEVRQEIRIIVDPLLIRLRQDLYGSGVSFGRISSDALPTTTVYTTNITQILTAAGFFTDPMTANGDMIARIAGVTTRLPIGSTGQVLAVSGGRPVWSTISASGIGGGMTNPMTAAGDLIYGLTGGTPARLPVGSNGQFLTISAGVPTWQTVTTTISGAIILGADVTGALPSGLKVIAIQSIPVASGTPVLADRLRYNGSQWAASSKIWQPLTNGSASSPELIFADGDVIMVEI